MAKPKRTIRRSKRRPARRAKSRARPARTRRSKRRPARRPAKQARKKPVPRRKQGKRPPKRAARRREARPPVLDRNRRQLPENERMTGQGISADRLMQAARTGHDEMRIRLQRHTETSPTLTAGDPDARWEDAYAVGDEAPGGDNPTPDQDRVDDIGKALGIRYRTDEELRGGEEVTDRDRHRWELDPASSDDWPHDPKKR